MEGNPQDRHYLARMQVSGTSPGFHGGRLSETVCGFPFLIFKKKAVYFAEK